MTRFHKFSSWIYLGLKGDEKEILPATQPRLWIKIKNCNMRGMKGMRRRTGKQEEEKKQQEKQAGDYARRKNNGFEKKVMNVKETTIIIREHKMKHMIIKLKR